MNGGPFVFVLLMTLVGIAGWLIALGIRSRHRKDEDPYSTRTIELLTAENEKLHGQVSRLEERIAVLERIATDKPNRLSAEIDNLR